MFFVSSNARPLEYSFLIDIKYIFISQVLLCPYGSNR